MKTLWIASVWPEPCSSAAGFRTMQLLCKLRENGYEIVICSPCKENQYRESLEHQGFLTKHVKPNDSQFDLFLKEYSPEAVFFDRFMLEEQFGWRVQQCAPHALRVLDTIDLHSLRRARQKKARTGQGVGHLTEEEMQGDDAVREIASIFRSYISLIISDAEIDILRTRYHVPPNLLHYCGFLQDLPQQVSDYKSRKHFVFIGNYNHEPNLDAVRILRTALWPQIQRELMRHGEKDVELHLYGAYQTQEITSFDNPASGFRVKGYTDDALATLSQYRINLAPLRFGAGIKGNISDGWLAGTPCGATSIAAEGMQYQSLFGGIVQDDWSLFAQDAVRLYMNPRNWEKAQNDGLHIIGALFNAKQNGEKLLQRIHFVKQNLTAHRELNFFGKILWHQQYRSTEYFSRWIEAKNSF